MGLASKQNSKKEILKNRKGVQLECPACTPSGEI